MSKLFEILAFILSTIFGKKQEKKPEIPATKSEPSDKVYNEDLNYNPPEEEKKPEVKKQERLVYQTELKNPKLNKYGCAFRCYQAIAELTCNQFLNIEEIEKLGENAFNKEYLKGNAEVKKPEEIARDVLIYFGKDKDYKIYNSGYRKNGKAFDWSNKETDNYDYIITKLIQKNKKDNHFVLCGKNEKMIFDPTPNSISAQLWNVETEYLYKVKRR